MNASDSQQFEEIWLADFEFRQQDGNSPEPVCLVAHEYRTGRVIRQWLDDTSPGDPPFRTDARTLFVAYYASAELSCFHALDWRVPLCVLDLFCEFRCLTNGLPVPCGRSLLGALAYFGLDGIEAADKDRMRELIISRRSYTADEKNAILEYCESDVRSLAKLLPAMQERIDLPYAVLRGRYMTAASCIEWNGIPIDTETLNSLRQYWERIQGELVREIDKDYGVFAPTDRPKLDTKSRFGQAIFAEADRWGLDPYDLADAARQIRQQDQDSRGEYLEAVVAARTATGLTVHRISKWEASGRDYSTFPALDVKARELATEYPILGIGTGYREDDIADNTDHAALLWELLRVETKPLLPRHDPELISEAAGLLSDGGDRYRDRLSFSSELFACWLARVGIPWPRLESGALALDDETFRQMSKRYPEVASLRELRYSLSQLRLRDLAVGEDGRNRCLLSAFQARTGRNQPSNSKFAFGPSSWVRSLIKPRAGRAVAYIDWEQQEFGIAAALSEDAAMMEAYRSGDPYLTFAKQAGAVPSDATKESHAKEREQFKVSALAVQYGMGADSLAKTLDEPTATGRRLLEVHRQTYPRFWRWSQAVVDHAMLYGWLQTVFGWRIHVGPDVNPRMLANFPMQSNGAEMLRLACCFTTEREITVCAPVHDAILIEAPDGEICDVVAETQQLMRQASEIVLGGFSLRSDADIVRYPDRYMDKRGLKMWETVTAILERVSGEEQENILNY